jgi:hypothetical protein
METKPEVGQLCTIEVFLDFLEGKKLARAEKNF